MITATERLSAAFAVDAHRRARVVGEKFEPPRPARRAVAAHVEPVLRDGGVEARDALHRLGRVGLADQREDCQLVVGGGRRDRNPIT